MTNPHPDPAPGATAPAASHPLPGELIGMGFFADELGMSPDWATREPSGSAEGLGR